MDNDKLALEYAHRFWIHYSEFARSHQRTLASGYTVYNMAVLTALKALNISDSVFPMYAVSAMFAVLAIVFGLANLSSLFIPKGAPEPLDKFSTLAQDLRRQPRIYDDILCDYDKSIESLKKQIHIKGLYLRAQCMLSILTTLCFFFVFV